MEGETLASRVSQRGASNLLTPSRSGFNLLELAVAVAITGLALVVFYAAYEQRIARSVADSLTVRARDVFLAVTAVNAEREPLGLPSLWSSAPDPLTAAQVRAGPVAAGFSNSTDFFRHLIEGGLCKGLAYENLAGGGVPTGRSGAFSATNNAWTVAVNLRADGADTMPLLITRNVELAPLAAKMTQRGLAERVRYDPAWEAPLGQDGFVCLRKSGAVFFGLRRAVSYRAVCGGEPFDARVDKDGQAVTRPLTYLTPSRAVVPGGISP